MTIENPGATGAGQGDAAPSPANPVEAANQAVTLPAEADEQPGDASPGTDGKDGEKATPTPEEAAAEEAKRQERREARRARADRARHEAAIAENARLKAELEHVRSQAPAKGADDGKPKPESYEGGAFDPEYISDLSAWKIEQRQAQREQRTAESATKREAADRLAADWSKHAEAFAAKTPDFAEAFDDLTSTGFKLSAGALSALAEMGEAGPAVVYHLANHPDDAAKFAGLSEAGAIRMLGRIEAQLGATPPAQPRSKVSSAPPPVGAVKGRASPDPDLGTMSFADFEKHYGKRMAERAS